MRRPVLVTALLLLAIVAAAWAQSGPGASSDAGGTKAPPWVVRDRWAQAPAPPGPTVNHTLVDADFSLAPVGETSSREFPFHVPERTQTVLVTLVFRTGASHGFTFMGPSGCGQSLGPLVVGDGTTVTVDCGPMSAGEDRIILSHNAGHLDGQVRVIAAACLSSVPCPHRNAGEGPGQPA